jgi:transcriptional regulator with XRE-family HTH domain
VNPNDLLIAKRLRDWGVSRFGSVTKFAEKLGISPENLSPYLNGKRRPGNKMQDRLRALECDLNYLFTGETNDAIKKRFAEIVEREKKQQPTEKEFAILTILRVLGITDPLDFNLYFDYARASAAKLDRERNKPTKKKREGK